MRVLKNCGLLTLVSILLTLFSLTACGEQSFSDQCLHAIHDSRRQLIDKQLDNGAFPADGFLTHPLGTTCLAALALVRTTSQPNDPPLQAAIEYLRRQSWEETLRIHEIALGVMVFVTVGNAADVPLIDKLASQLVDAQTASGGWTHLIGEPAGDLSVSYFAVLALREAAKVDVEIPPQVWEKARSYWVSLQNADGGWFDFAADRISGNGIPQAGASTPTATLAGAMVLSTCDEMLRRRNHVSTSLEPVDCCRTDVLDESLKRGLAWFSQPNLAKADFHRPEALVAFHLYGLELCNRMEGSLFPGERQWYRDGAIALLAARNIRSGLWEGTNDVIATSHALLFLSAEIAPALIGKVKFRDEEYDAASDFHSHDIWNLTERIVRLHGWPRRLAAREVLLSNESGGQSNISDARWESPVLFLTHAGSLRLSDEEVSSLKKYLEHGGLLFAAPGCHQDLFNQGFLKVIQKLFPDEEAGLTLLPGDHPIYHSHFSLTSDEVEFYGIEAGCRTAVIYCPVNLSCQWNAATSQSLSKREAPAFAEADRAVRIGINVVTFAAGDEPPAWPEVNHFPAKLPENPDPVADDRSLLRVAQLRLGRSWNMASRALPALLKGVNAAHGAIVAPQPGLLSLDSAELFDHMLLFLHGGGQFSLTDLECRRLRTHLQQGGVLFADACCGSKDFDASFRKLTATLFPDQSLRPIPLGHKFYSARPAFQLEKVKLRSRPAELDAHGPSQVQEVPPLLEGIEINGRLAIIYSRYDISCALDGTSGHQCEGYLPDDALRIAVNIVMYALLQDNHSPAAADHVRQGD